jgi:putative ATP-dependent endonuclease of the OLD family
MSAPIIYRLNIERFRGIKRFEWHPEPGVNIVLGGGDVGKTTILDAIGLLLSPTNPTTVSDAEYYLRDLTSGFSIEAIMKIENAAINQQGKPSWPWEWKNKTLAVPALGDEAPPGEPVYRFRVCGTPDLELTYEIVQPSGDTDHFAVSLRRAIGVVRLSGDDRNDRDLRLVQGSALDRLLSDKALRSRLGSKLAKSDVKNTLEADAQQALVELDTSFKKNALPSSLDLAITGAQGVAITALIGLTADRNGIQLPLSSWGAGTRRLAALAIAEQDQNAFPVTLVDEVERGLETYRQRVLIQKLQSQPSQAFLTTHSATVISAATEASIWYLDGSGKIGPLDRKAMVTHQKSQPETFLSRLAIVAEGVTEVGFVTALLEQALGGSVDQYGIHISDGGGHETTLNLLKALSTGGLRFAAFVDNENKHAGSWAKLSAACGVLLFQWKQGCLEENLLKAVPDDKLEAFIADADGHSGDRLRTLAQRLDIDSKQFPELKAKAAEKFRDLLVGAMVGSVPPGKQGDRKKYEKHGQRWFKTEAGGRELFTKVQAFHLWPSIKNEVLPFVNGVRQAVELAEVQNLAI